MCVVFVCVCTILLSSPLGPTQQEEQTNSFEFTHHHSNKVMLFSRTLTGMHALTHTQSVWYQTYMNS